MVAWRALVAGAMCGVILILGVFFLASPFFVTAQQGADTEIATTTDELVQQGEGATSTASTTATTTTASQEERAADKVVTSVARQEEKKEVVSNAQQSEQRANPVTEVAISSSQVLYTDTRLGYSFKRPAEWRVYQVPSMSYARLENANAAQWDSLSDTQRSNYFKIEVVVLPRNGFSLQEWVRRQNTTEPRPNVLEQKDIEVAGYPALYQLEQFGSLVHPAVFIQKDDKIYILNISGTYGRFQKEIEDFITNFEFVG